MSLSTASPHRLSLAKVRDTAPDLVKHYETARATLDKHGLAGERAAVYLVIDYSGSMAPYFRDGSVQHLAEQILALSANLDDDGVVPTVFFSTDVDALTDVRLGEHRGRVKAIVNGLGRMGQTNYHWGMDAVLDHYLASGTRHPALVIFQTDGGPTSRTAAERFLCKASHLPLFWQFIGFGDPASHHFDFLRKLDQLPVPAKRRVDNAGFFPAGRDPRAHTDETLYSQLLAEWPHWLTAAREAEILPTHAS